MTDARLHYLIDCALIDQEALTRGYEKLPDVQKRIAGVKDRMIYNKFFSELLIPSIKITDDEIETYYKEHPDLFMTPIYVKVEEIRVKNQEKAKDIWAELEAGADFSFLSKRSLPQKITSQHWMPVNRLAPSIKEGLIQIEEGDRFGPVLWNDFYSIFLLKRRQGGKLVPFDKAQKDAHDKLWKERYDQAIKRWESILRSSSEIVIYKDRLQAIVSGVDE
jgi:hypothetical protein